MELTAVGQRGPARLNAPQLELEQAAVGGMSCRQTLRSHGHPERPIGKGLEGIAPASQLGGTLAWTLGWALAWVLGLAGFVPGVVRGEEPVRVFVFAGQSNMVGADAHPDQIDQHPPYRGAGEPQPEVRFAYVLGDGSEASVGWEPLRPLRSFGPEVTFARRVRRALGVPIAIIKSAVGGTTVARDWNPDAPAEGQQLYPRTLKLIRESLAALEQQGVAYRLEAVCWHQGENDMLDRRLVPQYAEGLNRLVQRLRADLKAPELRWYVAEVSEKGIWGMDHRSNLGELHRQQQQVLRDNRGLQWVPTSHLAFEVMGSGQPHYHYGTQGQLQLGEAFAAAYLRQQPKGARGSAAASSAPQPFGKTLPLAPRTPVRLFVIAGQRNSEGEDTHREELSGLADWRALEQPQPTVLFRYSLGGGVDRATEWGPLGLASQWGSFGPELSLGARLRKEVDPAVGVAVVKFTHSGAQGPDWRPAGSPESHRDLYARFRDFVRDARADLENRGHPCEIAGVFWHLGENDTYFGPYAQNLGAWLQELSEATRRDWETPMLRWFVSEQHPQSPWVQVAKVNAALGQLAEKDPRMVVVPTADLPHGRRHFGTEGTLLLGDRYAEQYLKVAQ